jgi:hypothetical protein
MPTIDDLSIEIEAQASSANRSLTSLVKKLNTLSTTLGNIKVSNLSNLTDTITKLSNALPNINNINSSGFTKISKGLGKLNTVDSAGLSTLAKSITDLANGMVQISGVSFNADGINGIANALKTLGGVKSTSGVDNLLKIKDELIQFVNDMNSVGSVTFDVTNLTELISSISRLGSNSATTATANLPQISASLQEFVNKLNAIGSLTFDTSGISNLVAAISRLGYGGVTQAITNLPLLTTELNNLLTTLASAPAVSSNITSLVDALARLASQGGRVGTASASVVTGLNNTATASNRAKKSVISLAAAFGKFYATYFLVVRGLKKLWSSIESTADYIEAYNYYDVALGKIASDWEDQYEKYGYNDAESYADSFSERLNERLSKLSGLQIDLDTETLVDSGVKNLGLNITEITQYASQLASITNAVGQTGEVSLATASSFTKLAADMSSLFNVDYSDVASNLQSALIGQARAVYKYGIDITNATLQQYAYNLGVSKSVSEMTQAEKMQLRMIAILDQSRVAWGDQANTINSLSNMIRQLKNNLSEAGTVLGQLFVPMLTKIIPYINGAVIAIKRLLVSIAGIMGINLDLSSFGQGYSDLESDIDDTADALDDATASAKKFNKQVQALDELNILTTTDTSSTDTGTLADTLDLTNAILAATDEYEKAWAEAYAKMESKAQEIANNIEKALEPIKKLFSDIKIGDWFAVGQDVSNIIIGIEDFFIKAINGVDWKKIGNSIGDFLAGIDWKTIIKKGFELTFDIAEAIADVWFGAFDAAPIETSIITAIALLKFTGLGSALANAMSGSISKSGKFAFLGTTIGNTICEALIAAVIGWGVGQKLYELITGDVITMGFADQIKMIGSSFTDGTWKSALKEWGNDIADGVTQFAGDTIDVVSDATDELLNKITFPFLASEEEIVEDCERRLLGSGYDYFKEQEEALSSAQKDFENITTDGYDMFLEAQKKAQKNSLQSAAVAGNLIVDNIVSSTTKLKMGLRSELSENKIKAAMSGIGTAAKYVTNDLGTIFSGAAQSISNGFVSTFTKNINGMLTNLASITVEPNSALGIKASSNKLFEKVSKISVNGYADGGFVGSASLFYAGENGIPEILGTVGGKSAVAGGQEITGISDTIRDTSDQQIQLLQQQNELLMQLLEKDTGISDKAIFNSVRKSSASYKNMTGRSAFA